MHALDFFFGFFSWLVTCEAPGSTACDDADDPSRTQKPIGG